TRVKPPRAGRRIVADRRCVGRRYAVEQLRDCRHGLVERVAGKAPKGESRRMRPQAAQRDLLAFGETALRQMPRREQRVHVRVERDLSVVEQAEKAAGENRLTDRTGEKERGRVHRLSSTETRKAV